MTQVEYQDTEGAQRFFEEIYKVEGSEKISPLEYVLSKEADIIQAIRDRGGIVKTVNTELISKRRFKRKMAKKLKRQAKEYGITV